VGGGALRHHPHHHPSHPPRPRSAATIGIDTLTGESRANGLWWACSPWNQASGLLVRIAAKLRSRHIGSDDGKVDIGLSDVVDEVCQKVLGDDQHDFDD